MSTKTTFKRVALVAVASLGFGMLSVAPSQAANLASITDVTIARTASGTDASLFVGPAAGSALGKSYKVYTTNGTVSLADLTFTISSTAATAAATFNAFVVPGAISAGAKTAYLNLGTTGVVTGTNASAASSSYPLNTGTPALVGTPTGITTTTLAASAEGTTYFLATQLVAGTVGTVVVGADNGNAQITVYQTNSTTSIASSAVTGNGAASPAVGPNGQAGAYRVRFTTPNTTDTVNPAARITSVPAGSKILNVNPLNSYYPVNNSTATAITAASGVVNGSAAYLTNSTTTLAPVASSASYVADTNFYLWPDVAGTYTVVFFDDRNSNGIVDGNDISTTVSYVVGGAVATATIANLGGDAPTTATNPGGSTEYGALLKVTLKDAAGLAVVPNGAESVTVAASGSGKFTFKNASAISAVGSVSLTASDFNGKGEAFLNLTDATAETVTVSISGNGSMASVANSTNVVFRAAVVSGAQFTVTALQTTGFTGSAAAYTVPLASSVTWTATGTTSTATTTYYQAALIKDSAGNILGTKTNNSSLLYWEVLAANGTADATVPGSASWTIKPASAATSAAEQYTITGQTTINTSGTPLVVTSAAPAITSGTIS